MASSFALGPARQFHFRLQMVKLPSQKIMLAECTNSTISFTVGTGAADSMLLLNDVVFDSSWIPSTPTSANHGKFGVTFIADGHVQILIPATASQPRHGISRAEE